MFIKSSKVMGISSLGSSDVSRKPLKIKFSIISSLNNTKHLLAVTTSTHLLCYSHSKIHTFLIGLITAWCIYCFIHLNEQNKLKNINSCSFNKINNKKTHKIQVFFLTLVKKKVKVKQNNSPVPHLL